MYNNQYQMNAYGQVQQEQMNMYNPSQNEYYAPKGNVSPHGNYPVTAAPPVSNLFALNTTQYQGQTCHSGNQPIMDSSPSYSPPTPTNIVNTQTTVVTHAPGIGSTSFLHYLNVLNDSLCVGFKYGFTPCNFIYNIMDRLW